MIKSKKFFYKKINRCTPNGITIVAMVLLLTLLVVLSPLHTFCLTPEQQKVHEELNSSIVETLDEIDFSGFNNIVADFEEKQISIFS